MKRKIHREQLDKALKLLKKAHWPKPAMGWIKTLREVLGMTQRQLAQRMGISAPSLHALEKAEVKGAITIAKLSQAAEALGCELRISFLPRTSLAEFMEVQAYKKAEEVLQRTAQHMYLEDQATDPDYTNTRVNELAEEMIRKSDKRIWETSDE